MRIHPAASRIQKLATESAARFLVFDLLVDGKGRDITALFLGERRDRLERFAAEHLADADRIRLSPSSSSLSDARRWLEGHAGTDGVIAKRVDMPYATGDRSAMQKVKRLRTADCVVGGFRYGSKEKLVGSLLLGLYDQDGWLHHVGFTSSMAKAERAELTRKLETLAGGAGFSGRAPGGPSRWSTERSAAWVPLEPRLVVEVRYDHFSGGRFRHGTRFLRWRPDKSPRSCTFDQVKPSGSARKAPRD
jgi:ATP-dependent DNA ligase